MRDFERLVTEHGGLVATHELYTDGHSRRELAAAVRTGAIQRVRQGWFALPGLDPELTDAARVGGRVSCVSAMSAHGLWRHPSATLHVAVAPHDSRLRHPHHAGQRLSAVPAPVHVHWDTSSGGRSRVLLDLVPSLTHLVRCQTAEAAVATADSALARGLVTLSSWRRIVGSAPKSRRRELLSVQPLCESGPESLTYFRLRRHRMPVRCQVRIAGVGRVDFLIGQRLVIEVDGAVYHTGRERFEADRRRDAHLSRLGYRVLRFSYHQIMSRWPEVEAAIVAAVIRGDHQ